MCVLVIRCRSLGCITLLLTVTCAAAEPADDASRQQRVNELTAAIKTTPDSVKLHSARGDAHFFLGQFPQAVADYDRMVEMDPKQDASHWRRGIALFYADRFAEAARQFERYHSFDNVDRENGIWRYLCQHRAHGHAEARKGLLKYEKDDREPFADVYRLFAGTMTPAKIVERIESADITKIEREKRRFYAHLYIGLNHLVEDEPAPARRHLQKAVDAKWMTEQDYGPHYMWQVARLQLEQLQKPGVAVK